MLKLLLIICALAIGCISYCLLFHKSELKGIKFQFKKLKVDLYKLLILATSILSILLIACASSIYSNFSKSTKSENQKQKTVKINYSKFRLTNDDLSSLKASQIYSKYSKDGKDLINKIYQKDELSRDYAMTLVGKVIPKTELKGLGEDKKFNITDDDFISIVNTETESSKYIKSLINESKANKDTTYVLLFPTESNDKIKEFITKNGIPKTFKVAGYEDNADTTQVQPDLLSIAKYYFNVVGAPSYAYVKDNSISIAGNSSDEELLKRVIKQSTEKNSLYNYVVK